MRMGGALTKLISCYKKNKYLRGEIKLFVTAHTLVVVYNTLYWQECFTPFLSENPIKMEGILECNVKSIRFNSGLNRYFLTELLHLYEGYS